MVVVELLTFFFVFFYLIKLQQNTVIKSIIHLIWVNANDPASDYTFWVWCRKLEIAGFLWFLSSSVRFAGACCYGWWMDIYRQKKHSFIFLAVCHLGRSVCPVWGLEQLFLKASIHESAMPFCRTFLHVWRFVFRPKCSIRPRSLTNGHLLA